MTKNRILRAIGLGVLALGLILIGVKTTKAEITPTIQLTNSVSNWTVQTNTQLTLNASVQPSDYRILSRMEIRQGNNVLATCWNQNTCYYTLNVMSGTTYYQAIGYDVDGRIFYSQVMGLEGSNSNSQNFYVNLTANQYEVDPTANSGFYIDASVSNYSYGIREVRIYRVEDWKLEGTRNCANDGYNSTNGYSCNLRVYPSFNSNDAGRTYTYEAQVTNTNGYTSTSNRITIHVRNTSGGNNGNQLPGVYLDQSTVPQNVSNNQSVNIRANAWDNEGLASLTIYAYPRNTSGSSNHFEKYCGTLQHNIDCTLSISNFYGYEGQTFDVRAEAVDQAGQRTVSQYYTMTVNGNGSNNGNNQMPGIYLDRNTIPETVNVNSAVHIRAEAWDNEALNRIEIFASPRDYYGYGYNNYNSSSPFYRKVCYTSSPNLTCVLDINNFQGYNFNNTTFDVWAKAYDAAGQVVNSNSYTMKVVGTDNNNNNQKPGIYLDKNTIPSEVTRYPNLHIKASAWDKEGLSKITLVIAPINDFETGGYLVNAKHAILKDCAVNGSNGNCTFDVNDISIVGLSQTLGIQAEAIDAAGQITYSPIYQVKNVSSNPPSQTAPTVSVWTNGNVTSLSEDKALVVYGEAKSSNGVWGVEVRAQPSWNSDPIVRRCIMSNKNVTTGACNLSIGPFKGHANGTVKVWTIAWDSKTGMGGSSETKTIQITGTPVQNFPPSVTITPSRRAIASNQSVNWVVNASDTDGIEKIEIYVNARVVKTCTNVSTCSYTGSSYGSYAGSSISYAAKVWDKTGKSTWTGYDAVSVNRTTSQSNVRPASAR